MKKIVIMPLTEFRQSITWIWKKIHKEDLQILITVRGRPVLKIEKYENTFDEISNPKKEKEKNNVNLKKWWWTKKITTEIDWDSLL